MEYISLRRFCVKEHLGYLYNMMCSDEQYLFSSKMDFNNIDTFQRWIMTQLNTNFHDLYMVYIKGKLHPIGFVHDYEFWLNHGHCKISVYVAPKYRKIGIGSFAAIQFIDCLFRQYVLRKIYMMIYEYNMVSLECNKNAGFTLEGVLHQYRYYNGKLHDLYILSVDREDFYNKFNVNKSFGV